MEQRDALAIAKALSGSSVSVSVSLDDLRAIIREEVRAAVKDGQTVTFEFATSGRDYDAERIRKMVDDRLGPIREDEQPVGTFMSMAEILQSFDRATKAQ